MEMENKIIWVNFLHMYQPPWQDQGVIEQVAIESYDYLTTLMEKHKSFNLTLNITGSLIEQLEEIRPDILKRLQKLVKQGRIELTGSAKYHPILALLPTSEIKRQIELNQKSLFKYFKKKPKGFYLPEMAFSPTVAKIVKGMGYQWLILDEVHYINKVDTNILYKSLGLKIVFRNRKVSKSYPPRLVYETKKPQTIISATDAEIYGHFHKDWRGFIEKVFNRKDIQILTVGQYLAKLKKIKVINLRSASWESKEVDLKRKIPYILWNDPKNKIHKSLWQLTNLAIKLVNKYKDKSWARYHLDRGLSSCTFWWATAKRPSPFSPLTWNPDMIDNGSEELIRSIRSLSKANKSEKVKAEKIYINIKKDTWLTHWQKYDK